MLDYQTIANDVGAALRAAEQSAQNGNLGQTVADLGTLHARLGDAFHAANELGADIEWDGVAGNPPADPTRSGGGGKSEPPK